MQPAIAVHPLEEGGQLLLQQRLQEQELARVHPPHAAQVSLVAATRHEGGERALFEQPRWVRLV
ncbi:hypothetical protein D3C71_1997820 [compost metagenome]